MLPGPDRNDPLNIAVFIDGTWNTKGTGGTTNVRKLYDCTTTGRVGARRQARLYVPGVGEIPELDGDDIFEHDLEQLIPGFLAREVARRGGLASVRGGVTGHGTAARIKAVYCAIAQNFELARGDRLYLFGFSRGAFAVRSLFGFIDKVGILLRDHADQVEEAWRLYEWGTDPAHSALATLVERLAGRGLVRPDNEDEARLPAHLIGVWDTVGSLGLPHRLAWFSAPYTAFHAVDMPSHVVHARHALALHELRTVFEPTLWDKPGHASLEQVWFAGAHADVGGGYAGSQTALSDRALVWMSEEAAALGLAVEPRPCWKRPRVPRLHHEVKGWFVALHPTVRPQLTRPMARSGWRFHQSALDYLRALPRPAYRFWRPFVNARLRKVDRLADALAGVLALQGHAAAPLWRDVPDWWPTVGVDEADEAQAVVAQALDGGGALSPTACERLARALAIRWHLDSTDTVVEFLARALSLLESALGPDTPAARRAALPLIGRLESAAAAAERGLALLSQTGDGDAQALLRELAMRLTLYMGQQFHDGVGPSTPAGKKLRFRQDL